MSGKYPASEEAGYSKLEQIERRSVLFDSVTVLHDSVRLTLASLAPNMYGCFPIPQTPAKVSPGDSLSDQLGRPLRSLRVSVTDRCNLRCNYCMPEENYVWLPRQELLTFEEIARLVDVFTSLGVRTCALRAASRCCGAIFRSWFTCWRRIPAFAIWR